MRSRILFLACALLAAAAVPLHAQSSPLDQGRAAMARGDVDGAITSLEKAVAQSPKSAAAHYSLAIAYGAKAQGGNMMNALYKGTRRPPCRATTPHSRSIPRSNRPQTR